MSKFVVLEDVAYDMNDEEIKFLSSRLSQRVGTDVPEAITLLETKPELANFFESDSAKEYFDLIDRSEVIIQVEAKRRNNKKTQK